ncbi:hypothetical protein [Streptomyces capitiformicae]|uniref:Uncharacterized protein n=1 Tax=Streptomyces capitiformicae TaxID=2014920 RepID=A0A918ZG26_9ACTN|nr:hypothetical protein [Streptomyces capitiformicae]GHE51143.1 hypothetical protein GCM10017771_73240 [Streptomyces capitiformicae]
MTDPVTIPDTKADPGVLVLEFRHAHRLIDPSEEGVQTWRVEIVAGGKTVGSLRATRGLYWKADNLRERMADEQAFLSLVAEQLLDHDGKFLPDFEEFVDMASSVLVVDELDIASPWNDPWIVAGLASSVIDRLTDNQFAVVFPHAASPCTGAALLAEAATLLSAKPFSDELLIIDTALAAPEEAAHRVQERLRTRARYGGADPFSDDWDEDEEGGEEDGGILTARTRIVLLLALQDLSDQAWEEAAALGDEPLPRGAGGLFGALPPVTLRQDATWRRHMARTFDDLAADLSSEAEFEPRCTGEEMALHLGIARARHLTHNQPRRVRDSVENLPEHRRDFDWEACSDLLFQDHDVLMLFDNSLDGIEDGDSQVSQALGVINLAAQDWFDAFDPEQARDPARGFRHE